MLITVSFAIESDQNDAITLFVTAQFGRGKINRYDMQSVVIDSMRIQWEGGVNMRIGNLPAGDHYGIVHAKLADKGYETAVYPIGDNGHVGRMRPLGEVVAMRMDMEREARVDSERDNEFEMRRMYSSPVYGREAELSAIGSAEVL